MRGAVRRSREEWEQVVRRYERSGLSQRDFCDREGIPSRTLSGVLSRRRRAQREANAERAEADAAGAETALREPLGGFIPVELVSREPEIGDEGSSGDIHHQVVSGHESSPAREEEPGELVVELPMGVVLRFRGVAVR